MSHIKNLIESVLSAPPAPELELEQRKLDAREIVQRLPLFLRKPGGLLASRIAERKLDQVRSWNPVGSGSLLLLGPTGIGKSTAAAMLFMILIGRGVRDGGYAWSFARGLRWFRADLLSRVRREHPLGRGDAPEVFEAGNASLLVLDDAGWDRDVQTVSEILEERYGRGDPTLITSGKTLEELVEHYGAAVVRRITESGNVESMVINCFASGGR